MLLFGGTGNDTLNASGGSSITLMGGSGNDTISSIGNTGAAIIGGVGNSQLLTQLGGSSITMFGGTGNDTLVSTGGSSITLMAGTGNDTLSIANQTINAIPFTSLVVTPDAQVSGAPSTSTATFAFNSTSLPAGFTVGAGIQISGLSDNTLNGTFQITAVTTTSISYTMPGPRCPARRRWQRSLDRNRGK